MDDAPTISRTPRRVLKFTRASTVQRRHPAFLWANMLQARTLNLLTGAPGSGKSTILAELAAKLSSGTALPGQDPREPMNILMLSGEDDLADTMVWRLENQGADLARIWVAQDPQALSLGSLGTLRAQILDLKAGLVCIDPVQEWLEREINSNSMTDVRFWGTRLRELAKETGATMLLARHKRKTPAGLKDERGHNAGIGSIDWTAQSRSELSTQLSKHGDRFLQRVKGNVGPSDSTLGYEIEPAADPENPHGVLRWTGPVFEGSEEPGKVSKKPKSLDKVLKWLRASLSGGPKRSQEVLKEGRDLGFTNRTIDLASKTLVDKVQHSDGTWYWTLKGSACPGPE